MNERTLRFANVAAAAMVIGGLLVAALPGHVVGIMELVMVTGATAAGLYALVLHVPPTGWMSPFTWMSPFARKGARHAGNESDEIDSIRAKLSGWRRALDGGAAMPLDTVRLLKPLITATLDTNPEEPREEERVAAARALVSPLTWSVLTSDVAQGSPWLHAYRPSEHDVADLVHAVLDDLERLTAGGGEPLPTATHHPRAT